MKLPYFVTMSLGLGLPVVEQWLHSYCCSAVGSFPDCLQLYWVLHWFDL